MSMQTLETLKTELAPLAADRFANYQFFTTPVGDDVLTLPKEDIVSVLRFLRETNKFDFLMDICGADYLNDMKGRQKRFDVVYHLFSTRTNERIRLKVQVDEGESVPSVTPFWKGANWFERETYDMFGIVFDGHPFLTRILTHHEFVGHPLRKDYDADDQQHCSSALPIHFPEDPSFDPRGKNLVPINIGPAHVATHGTLRIMAELDGETIVRAHNEIGFLHRCFEKMAETHPYNQVIPYTDRLNYCSAPLNNVAYCKAVERLLGITIPAKAQSMRIILSEFARIIDHCVCVGAAAMDLGALTSFFHAYGYREQVYTLFEKLCGARLTVALTRVGGMAQDAPQGWFQECVEMADNIAKGIDEIEALLTNNKIFINRTRGVGAISAENAIAWGYTGPCLRAAGVSLDVRKANPYYGYDQLDWDVPIGSTGDVYDRYLVRIHEMRQSVKIIKQVAKNIPEGDYTIRDKNIVLPEKKDVYGNIEGLMNHFMLVIKGLRPPVGEIYDATEGANGELGFYLISDGSAKPYRLHARAPCFATYSSFPEQIKGIMISDVIAILGSINVIAGELDR